MLNRLYSWYGKKVVITVALLISALFIVAIYLVLTNGSEDVTIDKPAVKSVSIQKVGDIGFVSSFESIGTVEAISEAQLQVEAGGQVTSVTTEIGKTVAAGSVLATIENSAQRAVLLQAQGAYEAAVAGAEASGVGIDGAKDALATTKTTGVTTFQNAFISVDSILHNDIDDLFTITNGIATGFKLDGQGQASTLNSERTELEVLIKAWGTAKNSATTDTVTKNLANAQKDTLRVVLFIDTLNTIVTSQDTGDSFTEAQKNTLEATLYTARVTLNATLKQIEGAQTAITGATTALEQATIAGATNAPSASSAQVKIALGSLRGAQANYEKTIVRTPITGVVNALYLKKGEYAAQGQKAAIVANNNGLQILTGVSEADSQKITIGDTVQIDKSATGTVTALGGAVDPTTGKVAVKVSVENNSSLQNGTTVSVSFTEKAETKVNQEIIIPLSAIKMTGSGPVSFVVDQTNTLTALPLTIGTITGDSVVVSSGLSKETVIVVDARGLKEGEEVTVITK